MATDIFNQPVTDADARRAIAEGGRLPLWKVASALDRSGPGVGGLSAERVASLLEIAATEPWARSTGRGTSAVDLFEAACERRKEDGNFYRSLLPEDLADDEETGIRDFAVASKHPVVRAHLLEILWVRFKKHDDAAGAIDARLEAGTALDAEDFWPDVVQNLGRLTTMILTTRARARVPKLVDALERAKDQLRSGTRPFAFPVLAEMVVNTLLAGRPGRDAFTRQRGDEWGRALDAIAKHYQTDELHGHDALVVRRAWTARWHGEERARDVSREIVSQLQRAAAAADAAQAPGLYQRALQAALDYGLPDLAQPLRLELMNAAKAAIPTFKRVSVKFELPTELMHEINLLIERAPTAAAAIRQLSVFPGLLEIDRERVLDAAQQQLGEAVLLGLIPTTKYHPDGKITHQTPGGDANVGHHAARLVGGHLAIVEILLRHTVDQLARRVEPTTLLDALASWPHLAATRRPILAHASERFASGDLISSAFIAATQFEAVLRDLLRAGGYHALKAERGGVLADETLNSLLRADFTRGLLGDGFCTLAEHVLCDSALGWNLRNEIAHGTIRVEALTVSRVLLLWLLIIRLTCFVARDRANDETNGDAATARETIGPTTED